MELKIAELTRLREHQEQQQPRISTIISDGTVYSTITINIYAYICTHTLVFACNKWNFS